MATLAEKLVQAEAAYHALMIGESARVVVDSSGERVEYTATNSAKLEAYIAKLKYEIAHGPAVAARRGPAGALF